MCPPIVHFREGEKKTGDEAPWTSPVLRADGSRREKEACRLVGIDCPLMSHVIAPPSRLPLPLVSVADLTTTDDRRSVGK
jgi:hypothetical protein